MSESPKHGWVCRHPPDRLLPSPDHLIGRNDVVLLNLRVRISPAAAFLLPFAASD
jgi:hypothetical protein